MIITLIESKRNIIAIKLAYAAKLALQVQKTDVSVQKIDNSFFQIYCKIMAAFQVLYKLCCWLFF